MWCEKLWCPICDENETGKVDHVTMDSTCLCMKSADKSCSPYMIWKMISITSSFVIFGCEKDLLKT